MDRSFTAAWAVEVKLILKSKNISLKLSTDIRDSVDTEK